MTLELFRALQPFIRELMKRASAMTENGERDSYAPWFKQLTVRLLEQPGVSYAVVFQLTGISIKTLEKFKSWSEQVIPSKEDWSGVTQAIAVLWQQAPWRVRLGLDSFWFYLARHAPDLKTSYGEVRNILRDLGLRHPRGPRIKDEGTQVKKKFKPHALWEGDGKHLSVRINGERFHSCWYAFIDQHTTLLTGYSQTPDESSPSLTHAVEDGKAKTGLYPVGILIDNRMTASDHGAVTEYCKEKGIVLIKTFPGNSKSNGTIEGNFSIYERFVGELQIQGRTQQELADSFMRAMVEVFTQQRNHSKRKRLEGRTPSEATQGVARPEELKSALEHLRDRFQKAEIDLDAKFKLVESLLPHFGILSEESLDKLKKLLKTYSGDEIVAACASYLARVKTHPDQRYRSEYFLAILRNKREENAKRVYNEEFRAKHHLHEELLAQRLRAPHYDELAGQIRDYLAEIATQGIPTRLLLGLESLAWWLVGSRERLDLPKLWSKVTSAAEVSIPFSLTLWAQINEFLHGRVGNLLHAPPPGLRSARPPSAGLVPAFVN